MCEILEDVVSILIAAGIVDDVEAVYIEYDYPIGIIQELTGIVSLLTYLHKTVPVSDLCDLVYERKALYEHVLGTFLAYIDECTAEQRKRVACCADCLITEGIPMVASVHRLDTQVYAFNSYVPVSKLHSLIEGISVIRMYKTAERIHVHAVAVDAENSCSFG